MIIWVKILGTRNTLHFASFFPFLHFFPIILRVGAARRNLGRSTSRLRCQVDVRVCQCADYHDIPPACQGVRVSPSGRLPSVLVKPRDSVVTGTPAAVGL